jgi:peptidyl-prolyl cis-trans isomerase D
MLNVMRRGANSWIIKILLVFIALSFVVWGVGDDLGRSTRKPVVEAKNWIITPREFSSAYDAEFQRMRQRFGGSLDKKMAETLGLKQRTLNALINLHLIQDAGRNLRLTVSPKEMRRAISENKAFQSAGKFDKSRYDLLLRSNRMTPKEYEYKLRRELINNQLQQALGHFPLSPEILVKDSFALANETRQIETLKIEPTDLEKSFNPDDETLQAHLTQNIDRFMTNAEVKIRHILLNTDSVRSSIKVSEAEMQEYYDEHRDDYVQKETREARHILIKIEGDVDEAAALEKIQQAEKRIKNGEAFETVAKEMSDDISAAQGGSLGQFGRGMMVKQFDDVTFALAKNEVSTPVKTQFGYHIIRVDSINAGKSKTFSEVIKLIEPIIVEREAANKIYDISITLEDQLFASGDLKAISGDLNLHYRETDYFSRADSRKLKGIEKEGKFQDAAFSSQKGDISPVIELSNNRFFALEVLDKKPPVAKTLAEAKKDVLNSYRKEQAIKKAKELMEEARKGLADGKSWEAVAQIDQAIKTQDSPQFKREGNKATPSASVRAAAFKLSMNSPVYQDVVAERNSFTILRLKQITKADPKEYEKAAKELRVQLQQSLGFEQLSDYLNGLWKKSEIKINQTVLAQF